MGEIKSTLDLVMERTRHLTQTKAEKAAQEAQEQQQRIGGLIQQFLDQILTPQELERKLDAMEAPELRSANSPLSRELLARLTLDPDLHPDSESHNRALLGLLETLCGVDSAPLAEVLAAFGRDLRAAREKRTIQRLADLAADYGIQGSALIPNLARDPQWPSTRDGLIKRYTRRLAQAGPTQEV